MKTLEELSTQCYFAKHEVALCPFHQFTQSKCSPLSMSFRRMDKRIRPKRQGIKRLFFYPLDGPSLGRFAGLLFTLKLCPAKRSKTQDASPSYYKSIQSWHNMIIPLRADLPRTTKTCRKMPSRKEGDKATFRDGNRIHVLKSTKSFEHFLKYQLLGERNWFREPQDS